VCRLPWICSADLPRCHPLSLHARMRCSEPCQKMHERCGHQCRETCGQPCGDCQILLPDVTLHCGHKASMTCCDLTSGVEIACREPIEVAKLPCGHTMEVICSTKNEIRTCMQACDATLDCGHNCPGTCSVCRVSSSHLACQTTCGRPQTCGHHCLLQ